MNDAIQSLIKSRRFWAGLVGVLVPVLNEKFNWGLSVENVTTICVTIVGWIVGESLRSSQESKVVLAEKVTSVRSSKDDSNVTAA